VFAALLGYFVIGGLSAPIVIGYTFREIGFSGVFVITTIVLVLGRAPRRNLS
jgi:hypothetical protein